jgi:hypothetical protein
MSTSATVPLTWDDLAAQAAELAPDEGGDLLREIVAARGTTAATGARAGGGWFLKGVHVQGHVGIGERGLELRFPETAGLTIVSARNGVGKTSAVDAVRHVASNGQKATYQLAADNLHCPTRSITVTVTNGRDEVQLTCGTDGVVRWRPAGGPEGPMPSDWSKGFERYRPVLLYPEISPVIESQGSFHEFLKEALDLSTLEQLQKDLNTIRKAGRDSAKPVREAHQAALQAVDSFDGGRFHDRLTALGALPDASDAETFRGTVAEAFPSATRAPDLIGVWEIHDEVVDQVTEGVTRLRAAQAGVVDGVDAVQEALARLLRAQPGRHVDELREQDRCPVCGTRGADWYANASAEHERLATMLRDVREAERSVKVPLERFQACLPPSLPAATRTALGGVAQSREHIDTWDRLARAGADLTAADADHESIKALYAESTALREWYRTTRAEISNARNDDADRHVDIRNSVEAWYGALARNRAALDRAGVAERLAKTAKRWIERARDEIFAPIEKEIIDVWGYLSCDSDVQVTSVKLAGGVQKAKKVDLGLILGAVPVPGADGHAVLSTGQRNALSLATYLPRATQDASPFRFLVLDDPIHALDDWRVRYLARHLAGLADRYQIILFTHDDRLWHALKARGLRPTHLRLNRPPDGASHVRAIPVTYPSEHVFKELDSALSSNAEPLGTAPARAAMTLALCRQAVDMEATTQVEILGRRAGKAEKTITARLRGAATTRKQLELLNTYAGYTGAKALDLSPYEELIELLNHGAHAHAPESDTLDHCWQWVRQSRELAGLIRGIDG